VGTYPGQWCPASAQPCRHTCHLGFEVTCDVPLRRLRLSPVTGNSLPLYSTQNSPFPPSPFFPVSWTPAYGYRSPNSFPPPVSGKKGALVAIPWLPKSLQVHRRMGKNGNVWRFAPCCCLVVMPCIVCGYVAVGYARLRQGAERDWSNPNGQISAGAPAGKGDRGRQDGSGHGGLAIGLPTGERASRLGGCGGRAAPSSRGSTGATEVG
jgi:hypothetical protein